MSKKVMKLMDDQTNRMECKVCGSVHYPMIRPRSGGRFVRGAWQCVNGCNLPEAGAERKAA
ncbi:MAG: hypothetical protein QM704_21570 [Anaeromyxobacteraceae bacterium]